jgi:nitroreductase
MTFNDSKPRIRAFSKDFRDEFIRLLKARRSIRKFKNEPVPREVIERILNAAIEAPSGKNRQNWRFYILTGEKRDAYLKLSQKSWLGIKDILQKRLKPSLYDFTERFFYTLGDAPVMILCYSLNDDDEKHLTSVGSVYMAVENLNLAAVAEGLGCCTMGAPLEIKKEVDEFLGLTDLPEYREGRLELLCGVALGVPDHDPPKAPRQIEQRFQWL